MTEIKRPYEIPVPLLNYVNLIRERKSPYWDIVRYLLKDMEIYYKRGDRSEVIYTINPRMLQKELEDRIKHEKVTRTNVCRTILALFYGSELEEGEDFFITTSARGRKNYHVKLSSKTFSAMKTFVPGIL